MLKINVNQEKQLTFEVQIGGVNHDQVSSQFKISIGEIAYTFPARVGKDEIVVDLPPLHKVIGSKIKEGDEADITLEIIADGHLLTPWKDKAILSNPLVIEATIKDGDFVANPAFQANLVVKDNGAKQITTVEHKKPELNSVVSEDIMIDNIVKKLSSKLESMISSREKLSEKEENMKKELKDEVKKEEEIDKKTEENEKALPTEKVTSESKTVALEKLLNKTIDTFKLSETKKVTLEEFKKNLSKNDIINFMSRRGTKNKEIQELIYEQARLNAKKDGPAYILKEVSDILKK